MESALGNSFGMQSSSSNNVQATSINHLVRKKVSVDFDTVFVIYMSILLPLPILRYVHWLLQ